MPAKKTTGRSAPVQVKGDIEDHLLPVVPARQSARWVAGIVMVLITIWFVLSAAENPNFEWNVVSDYIFSTTILTGLWLTIWLTVASMLIGIVIGTICASMCISTNIFLRVPASIYVWLFRGTPILVQLIFWFNLAIIVPIIYLKLPFGPVLYEASANDLITPYTAALLGLGLNEGAYMSEIVRAGILSVDPGQKEAARALGMTRGRIMRRIVLPQAIRIIIPPTGNQIISMLKTTSLVSVIALSDLLYSVQNISSRTFQTIPLLIVACVWYLIATTVLTFLQSLVEKAVAPKDVSTSGAPAKIATQMKGAAQ